MKKDEFEFLWEKFQKLEHQILELQEAVDNLIKTTGDLYHKGDMMHRPIGPGPDNYGRGWKERKLSARQLTEEESHEMNEMAKRLGCKYEEDIS